MLLLLSAVQNERDPIRSRKRSFEDTYQSGALSVPTLLNAENKAYMVKNAHYVKPSKVKATFIQTF